MNVMPGEINLGFSWEDSTEPNPPLAPNVYATSPDFDYAVHDLSLPSAQPTNGADLSALHGIRDTTKPYATNWSFFDHYNPSSHYDCDSMNYNVEPAHRIRMNSMASSASSQSYSLTDDRKLYLANSQQETPEMYLAYNTSYQPPFQSNYDTSYPSQYDTRVASQPRLTHPEPTHHGGSGPTASFGGYPQIYTQSSGPSFHPKTPAHSLDRPYKCDKCAASFSRNHDLKRHARIHLDVKPFPCSFCDKAFARKDALKRHILVKRCSKSSPHENNRDKQTPSQSPNVLAQTPTGEQDKSPRSSLTHHRSSPVGNQVSPIRASEATATRITSNFNEIKLQNIKCSMPTFI